MDLRYASVRNFVGRDLYGALDCAWLHRQAAAGVERAVARLAETAPGHRLLVLDALRPHRVQIQLWDHLDGTGLRQYVADPARGSIHSFGMALDATLIDAEGRELDMGTGFDEMTELSHPQFEARHLASGAADARPAARARAVARRAGRGRLQGHRQRVVALRNAGSRTLARALHARGLTARRARLALDSATPLRAPPGRSRWCPTRADGFGLRRVERVRAGSDIGCELQ